MSSPEDGDRLVTVHIATSDFEAQTVAAILRDREIDAVVFSAAIQAFGLAGAGNRSLGGIPVQVRLVDVERAQSALRSNKFLADSVDWDMVDVGEEESSAQALGRADAMNSIGQSMVNAGRIAALVLVVVTLAIWFSTGFAQCE